jgi:HEAT repeat protein
MNVRDQLTRTSDQEIVRRLGDDGDPDLAAVIYEAGKRRLGTSLSHLLAYLNAQDPDIRLAAVEALGDIGDAKAAEPLMTLLNDHEDRAIRDTAAWSLGLLKYRPAVAPLAWMLQSSEATVRSCAVAALVSIGDRTALPAIRFRLAQERDEAVRNDLIAANASLTSSENSSLDAARRQWNSLDDRDAKRNQPLASPAGEGISRLARNG